MKRLTSILLLLFFISINLSVNLYAQDVETLPDDPRVKRGTLANGLSYILIKNKDAKGTAHFGIAQKIGTTLEDENQKGMFKMLESLTVKGTRNFTDSTITQYLKSIGLTSDDLVFSTKEDDITYLIKNVPVSKGNSIDSSLLILYNWLGSINIDEEDIREETPFVKNRLFYEWDAEKRMDSKLLSELYPGSGYADMKYSDIDGIGKFTSKDLRNFYYKWFRPDFQAVVVVGDIDLNLIETKVKSIFVTIPKPLAKQKREYYKPEAFDGVKVCIIKDKEYDKTRVSINILKEPMLAKYKLTSVPYIQEYMDNAISNLLMGRLRDGIITKNLPVTNLSVEKGRFMNIHNLDAFSISFETLPQMVYPAIDFVSSEIGKMAKYGFNGQEFSKSKDIYFRDLEYMYDNRTKAGNDAYLQRALNHYYYGFSLASIELKFEIMKEILFSITLNQLNKYAQALLGQEDNIVISCKMPEYEGVEGITAERVMWAYEEAKLKTPSMELEAPVVVWPHFQASDIRTASVTSEVTDPVTGATVYMLGNGATVVLKDTGIDTVAFRAVSKGGYSLMKGVDMGNAQYVNDILNLGGLGSFSQPNIERLFSYNDISLRAEIGQNVELLEGYCSSVNLEKLLHTICWSFNNRRADETAFDVYKKSKVYEAAHKSLSPANAFRDSINYYNYSNRDFVRRATMDEIAAMEYSDLLYQMRSRFSNAADFVFVFVGSVDKEAFKSLVARYIGSIPGNVSKKESWHVIPNYLSKGNLHRRFLYSMVNPRTYSHITRSLGMEYNLENYVKANMLEEYLRGVLNEKSIRRYAARSQMEVELEHYPEPILKVSVNFETDSLNASNVSDIIDNSLAQVALGKLSAKQFSQLKEDVAGSFIVKGVSNSYWLDIMSQRYMLGKDFHSNYIKVLDAVTAEEFKVFVSKLIGEGNRISVIMDGTTRDVNTQNLFKEDEFIMDFFNVR